MKVFVTGATGFIGGEVARQLIGDGHEVVTIARTLTKTKHLTELGIRVYKGDITEKETLRAPMTGCDAVIHLAAWYRVGVRNKRPAYDINVLGTRNVLEMMRDLKIPKGVYTSTLAVNSNTHDKVVDETYRFTGTHLSEYDRTKYLAHYEVALPLIAEGLPLVIVMPGMVYGPGDQGPAHETLTQFLKRQLPLLPLGTAFCWGHVQDTARGHILALEKGRPGETYIIGGPVHTLVDVMALAERISGVPAPRILVGSELMNLMAGAMDIVGSVLPFLPIPETIAGERLRVAAGVTYIGSNAKARRELGFSPRSLSEGLPETVIYEMQQLGMTPKGKA